MGKRSDPLAVHGDEGGAARGDDAGDALLLELLQAVGRNRLDLRDDQGGPLLPYNLLDSVAVKHVDDMRAVGNLHGRRVIIAVDCDNLDPESLKLDGDFLAELA